MNDSDFQLTSPGVAGVAWRTITVVDVPSLVGLAEAGRAVDGGLGFLNEPEEIVERYFGDGGATAVGGFAAGQLVAACAVRLVRGKEGDRAVIVGQVHPGWRRRGVGDYLMSWSVGQGRALLAAAGAGGVLQVATESLSDDADRLYRAHGFTPIFEERVMRRALEGVLPERPLPPGVTLAEWEPALAGAFFDAYHHSFRDRPGFPGHAATVWIENRLTDENGVPAWSSLARHDGVAIGFLTASTARPGGFVVQVGVVPQWRRRGLATALMVTAMKRMQAAGEPAVLLTVNVNNPGAIAVYERLGFVGDGRRARYEKGF